MLSFFKFILCVTKVSKHVKFAAFSLKTEAQFSSLFKFFLSNNTKKNYITMYLRCSSLTQKQVFQNILFFAAGIIFSVLMF